MNRAVILPFWWWSDVLMSTYWIRNVLISSAGNVWRERNDALLLLLLLCSLCLFITQTYPFLFIDRLYTYIAWLRMAASPFLKAPPIVFTIQSLGNFYYALRFTILHCATSWSSPWRCMRHWLPGQLLFFFLILIPFCTEHLLCSVEENALCRNAYVTQGLFGLIYQ